MTNGTQMRKVDDNLRRAVVILEGNGFIFRRNEVVQAHSQVYQGLELLGKYTLLTEVFKELCKDKKTTNKGEKLS